MMRNNKGDRNFGVTARSAFFVIAILTCFGVMSDWASAKSLTAALTNLITDNPRIVSAKGNLDASGKAVDQAFAAYLPVVGLTLDGGYEVTDNQARRALGADTLGMGRQSAGVIVTQNLYDGSLKSENLGIAKLSVDIASESREAITQQVLFEGISVYHNILRQKRLVGLARASEMTIATQLELEDERVKRGGGIAVDVLLSKARLQIAKEQRVAFTGALRETHAIYRQVYGEASEVGSMTDPVPPMAAVPTTLDDALAIAQDDSPQIKSSEQATEIAARQRTLARSGYMPRLDLVAQANWEDDVDGTKGIRRDAALLVRLTWEIFSGFATRAQVAQASARYGESLANFDQAKRETMQAVMLSWDRLETARTRVSLLQNAVNIATEVFDARRQLRVAGKESAINVLDAETEMYRAQINYTNASYDARLAIYALLQAMGRLNGETLNLVPGQ
ncbi:MAG: TolC family protein [Rhodospirillaceae bacterium]|nr:TolC family protein [Rhodospirillaceae bacterium]MBT7287983.1 TolC family protein [Rhodospirillaceae bacterium]